MQNTAFDTQKAPRETMGDKTCYGDNTFHKNCVGRLLWNLNIGSSIVFDLLNVATTFANDHSNCRIWDNNFYLKTTFFKT